MIKIEFQPICQTCELGDRHPGFVKCKLLDHESDEGCVRCTDGYGQKRDPHATCGVEVMDTSGNFSLGYWPNMGERIRLRIRGLFAHVNDARDNVAEFCDVCVNNRDGRCAPIANGTSNNGTLEFQTRYTAKDANVGPNDSCIGKMNALGIHYTELPFSPRPGAITREFIRLLFVHVLPPSHN